VVVFTPQLIRWARSKTKLSAANLCADLGNA
jgi:hypothetical protein